VLRHLTIAFLLVAASLSLSGLRVFLMERLCHSILNDRRRRLFSHVLSVAPRRLAGDRASQVLAGFTFDLGQLQATLRMLLAVVIPSLFFIAIYGAAMLWHSWILTGLLALLVLPTVLATNLFGTRIHRSSHQAQEHLGGLVGDLSEALGGTKEIKLFGLEARLADRFGQASRRAWGAQVRRDALSVLHPLSVSLLVALAVVLVVVASVWLLDRGLVTTGSLTAFLVSLFLAYPPVQELSHALGKMWQLSSVLDRLEALEAMPPETDTAVPNGPLPRDSSVAFHGVTFAHDDGGFALRDLSFEIRAGERVAVVGPSGAGKSTLLELLPRFIEPRQGRIALGGVDIAEVPLAELRARIGLVTQVPFLFRGTLRDNLLAGNPVASEAALRSAVERARVDEFAARMPGGLGATVEAGGSNLSVGQRQRVAIARALLKDPQILLLDEPTSALDAESERHVSEAISRATEGRTTIIVAHRLSTVRGVDRILVMEGGRVVQDGSFEDLSLREGLFRELYLTSGFEAEA
jgi:ABC-type multidrug transport system fused ATPase/permease subunit